MRLPALIAALALLAPAARADTINSNTYGCTLLEDVHRIAAIDDDQRSLLKALLGNGMCQGLANGDQVILEKKDETGIYACVIPKGNTRCIWIDALGVNK